jgi:hypothetical protein
LVGVGAAARGVKAQSGARAVDLGEDARDLLPDLARHRRRPVPLDGGHEIGDQGLVQVRRRRVFLLARALASIGPWAGRMTASRPSDIPASAIVGGRRPSQFDAALIIDASDPIFVEDKGGALVLHFRADTAKLAGSLHFELPTGFAAKRKRGRGRPSLPWFGALIPDRREPCSSAPPAVNCLGAYYSCNSLQDRPRRAETIVARTERTDIH